MIGVTSDSLLFRPIQRYTSRKDALFDFGYYCKVRFQSGHAREIRLQTILLTYLDLGHPISYSFDWSTEYRHRLHGSAKTRSLASTRDWQGRFRYPPAQCLQPILYNHML